jgi:hypothetical protein
MDAVVEWLMAGDPAIRWQTMRDLLDAPAPEVEAERAKVASEGWGAALLAEQASDGSWGGGLYTPKWTSTFYTLLQLTAMGLPGSNPQARVAARLLLDKGRCVDGGLRYWGNRTMYEIGEAGELCVTGMGLRMLATFRNPDPRLEPIVRCLLATQLHDGGWNCQRRSSHGSFNTTLSALEGLRGWSAATGGHPEIESAAARGREFFLAHRLFRSHRTSDVVREGFTRFTFPYHWHYDVLRGLDYFQSVGAPHDERFADAIELLRSRRKPDGRWRMQNRHRGHEYFVMEGNGEPSRWNSLRALRVLRWWERL